MCKSVREGGIQVCVMSAVDSVHEGTCESVCAMSACESVRMSVCTCKSTCESEDAYKRVRDSV